MEQVLVMRLFGALLTIGGIALAAFVNAEIPDKTLLHLAVTGIAAIVCVIGIGVYEDAADDAQNVSTPDSTSAIGAAEPFAPPHTAR